jgi:hypothetical protein
MTTTHAGGSKKRTFVSVLVWLVLFFGLIFVVAYTSNRNKEAVAEVVEDPWEPGLLACNDVNNAEPNDDFTTCLSLADDGWIEPMYRLVWAYSQSGEYYDLERVNYWLKRLSVYDDYAEVYRHILLFNQGKSDNARLAGERGIRKQALINEPIASAYLASMYYLNLNIEPKKESISWLLQRAYKEDKNWLLPTDIATIYAQGYLGIKQPEKAIELLKEAAKIDFPYHANNIAWLMSTTTIQSLADYATALDIALLVTNDEDYAQRYTYVDTLAAAYAANGDYSNAVKTQQTAVDLVLANYKDDLAVADIVAPFKARLALFEQEMNYVEEAAVDGEAFFASLKSTLEIELLNMFDFEIKSKLPPVTSDVVEN